MIERIKIENFQSHKKTELEFDKGVNVIIGQSDSGKTAVFRALKWAVQNRPLGDAFRSRWGGDTSVVLQTDDYRVTRHKGKADHYLLERNDHDSKATEFKAFGTSTPEEIVDALNLSDLNIQGQMDSSFLLSNNPGEVARHFNKVAGIDQIDHGLKNVEKWVREINQNIKTLESDIEEKKEALEDFEYLDKMEIELEVLETTETKRNQLHNKAGNLSKLIDGIEMVGAEIKEKSAIIPAGDLVDLILKDLSERKDRYNDYHRLKNLGKSIVAVDKQIQDHHELISIEPHIDGVLDLLKKSKSKTEYSMHLSGLINSIESLEDQITQKKEEIDQLEVDWHENMPETCPLCGE